MVFSIVKGDGQMVELIGEVAEMFGPWLSRSALESRALEGKNRNSEEVEWDSLGVLR